jgi:hypothetical protein
LWSPAANRLQFEAVVGLPDRLRGRLVDLTFDGISNAPVSLSVPGQNDILTTKTGPGGTFSLSRMAIETLALGRPVVLRASQGERQGNVTLETTNLFFDPIHYRPLPAKTAGLAKTFARSMEDVGYSWSMTIILRLSDN